MKIKLIFLAALLLIFLLLAVPLSTSAENTIRITGSSTMLPFVNEILELHKQRSGVEYETSAGGSGKGINDAIEGISDIGIASRSIRDNEAAILEELLVGLDTIVFVVNERNPINRITKQQLAEMFTTPNADWSQFGGNNKPINLVNKEVGRATLDLFEDYAEVKSSKRDQTELPKILETAIEVGANLEVATIVGGLPNAIGYLSLGTAQDLIDRGMPIKILNLDGVDGTIENIVNGSYPITRELNVVYLQESTSKIESLLDLMMSEQGQAIIEGYSFVPVR